MKVVTRPPATAPASPSAPPSAQEIALRGVVVATDFSDASQKPFRHATSIARHFGTKLYLAHVVSSIGYTIAGAGVVESVASSARRELDQLEKQLVQDGDLAGVVHEFIVRQGDVWQELQGIL